MMTVEKESGERAAMLDVRDVSKLLNVSVRTVYRLADSGKLPRPCRLNSLVRWNRESLDRWIAEGCQPVRVARGGAR